MSKKALNQKNLITLGPERLAALLIEVTKGNAAAQRRLRMELSAGQGHDEIAHDLRKRFAAIRQAKGRIPRKTRGSLGKELHAMIALIDTQITPEAPSEACDLLWALLHLSDGILARIDDRGEAAWHMRSHSPVLSDAAGRNRTTPDATTLPHRPAHAQATRNPIRQSR